MRSLMIRTAHPIYFGW